MPLPGATLCYGLCMTDSLEGKAELMLTPEDAFTAMFEFLRNYWSELKTANLADVLSDLHPAERGQSSDPAMWADWMRAVRKVVKGD